jgi:hypothetical protein
MAMAAVAVLRASSRLSLRAAALPALHASAGRLRYASSCTRMFSSSARAPEPVTELNVPKKSEPKTAGVEGPHRRAQHFFLAVVLRTYCRLFCLQTIMSPRRLARHHLRHSPPTRPATGCSSTLCIRKKNSNPSKSCSMNARPCPIKRPPGSSAA